MLLLGIASPVYALNSTAQARQQADQIIRNQSQKTRLYQQEMQKALGNAPQGKASRAPASTTAKPHETCFQIDKIRVTGSKLIAKEKIAKATAPFEGTCLGLTKLNDVLKALTYLYIKRGYVASRAYLPQQDLSSGTLTVNIVEGSLADIVLKGGKGTAGQLATAFPGLKGKPVNLRDVEQGLDQINRLGSNKATIALGAGKTLGDTILGVTIDKSKPWHASFGSDTLGSPSTGVYETRLGFGLDSPFGVNDQWQFSYQRSMDRNPVFFSGKTPNSDSATASVSIPYGYFTGGIDASWSQYYSSIHGLISSFDTSGRSLSISPYLTWQFYRDQTSKSWMTGRLNWKSNDNFILGSRIDTSSRTLSVASVELGHTRQFLGGTLTASIGYDQGLKAFGAFNDATALTGSPKGQFGKGTVSLSYSRVQNIGPVAAIFSTSLSGQWSRDPLFASEQMALGGSSSVRGTRDAVLSGSNAFLVRNELSFLLPAPKSPALAKAIGRFEPYVGFDFARSVANVKDGSLGGDISSGTLGIRNRGGSLGFDVSWSRIFSVSPLPAGAVLPKGVIQAQMTVSF